MPFINLKLSVQITDEQKEKIQNEVSDAAVTCLHKPKQYVMVGMESGADLWFAGKKLAAGAFVSVSLYGQASPSSASNMTANICKILEEVLGIPGNAVYVAYYPLDNWGWNGSNF